MHPPWRQRALTVHPEESRYHLLKVLEDHPGASQRDLARAMGVSLGKAHYVLRGLIDKGLVKARNFQKSDEKGAYLYQLTPSGVSEKVRITRRYLARRQAEYERIRAEIEVLRAELGERE